MLCYFSCVLLYATLWTATCQASLFMEFSRQEYWSGLPSPPPGDYPDPRVEPTSLTSTCIGRCILFHLGHLGSMCVCMCLCLCACVYAQSCPTLRDPADCSPPGSSIHGIFQARILEWVSTSFSKGFQVHLFKKISSSSPESPGDQCKVKVLHSHKFWLKINGQLGRISSR